MKLLVRVFEILKWRYEYSKTDRKFWKEGRFVEENQPKHNPKR